MGPAPQHTEAQHYWLSKLCGFKFHVGYKKGQSNKAVDSHSHRLEDATLYTIIVIQADWWLVIQQMHTTDHYSLKLDAHLQ